MGAGLVFVYGALTDGHDEDTRADIDAVIDGRPMPSEIEAENARQAAAWEFARGGDIG